MAKGFWIRGYTRKSLSEGGVGRLNRGDGGSNDEEIICRIKC